MTENTALEKLRPCGRLETFSTARHHLGFYKNVSCTATYVNASSTTSLENLIFRALHTVIVRHAMLSAIPLNENKSYPEPYFARLPSIDLRTGVEFIKRTRSYDEATRDEELDLVLQEQHNRDFKTDVGSRPFWRLIVLHGPENLRTFTATWVFHHSLADGTSGLTFHRSFLSALRSASSIDAAETIEPVVKSPDTPLLPPLEELHPLPTSALFIIKALLGSIFPRWFDPRPSKLFTGGLVSSDPANLNARFRSLVLSSATTKKLLHLSRENKTTMTGTLQCIFASATLSNLDAEKYDKVKVDGPISMRRFMKWDGGSVEEELVNGMTEYGYVHARPVASSTSESSFSWDEARSVRATIQKELDKQGSNSVVGLLRYVSDIHKFFKEKEGKERTNTFEMSNLGVFKHRADSSGDAEGWKISRCMFSQSPNVAGAAFAASIVTGGDGCAVIAFTWYDGIVESALMEKIIQSVGKEVEALVLEKKPSAAA